MYKKMKSRILAIAVIALALGSVGAHATGSGSDYVAPVTAAFTTMEADLIVALPVIITVAVVLTGAALIWRLFKRLAK